MVTPHVCFADELHKLHNGNNNNNNNNSSCNKKWLLDLEPTTTATTTTTLGNFSPRFERNLGFFQQLSRRFGRRSTDDLNVQEEDTNSSSTDSTAATTTATATASETSSTLDMDMDMGEQERQMPHGKRRSTSSLRRAFERLSLTSRSLSCSGPTPPPPTAISAISAPLKSALKSKAASTVELHRLASKSASSSSACSTSTCSSVTSTTTTTTTKKDKSKRPPQRILRQPVAYTYLKGISGLPTQRVPRSAVCCQYARR
ncbi:hypothetical protein ACLKA7_017559 [Drosophila subpalustris]